MFTYSLIVIDSLHSIDQSYDPKTLLEDCKHLVKGKETKRSITANFTIFEDESKGEIVLNMKVYLLDKYFSFSYIGFFEGFCDILYIYIYIYIKEVGVGSAD